MIIKIECSRCGDERISTNYIAIDGTAVALIEPECPRCKKQEGSKDERKPS
jgi:ribosomal protein S27AE